MSQLRFVIVLCLAIAAAGSAFVTHLALRFQNVAMGYRVQDARQAAQQYRERISHFRLELAARRSPQALIELGRSQLGMVEPDRVMTIIVGRGARAARPSGRAR